MFIEKFMVRCVVFKMLLIVVWCSINVLKNKSLLYGNLGRFECFDID